MLKDEWKLFSSYIRNVNNRKSYFHNRSFVHFQSFHVYKSRMGDVSELDILHWQRKHCSFPDMGFDRHDLCKPCRLSNRHSCNILVLVLKIIKFSSFINRPTSSLYLCPREHVRRQVFFEKIFNKIKKFVFCFLNEFYKLILLSPL